MAEIVRDKALEALNTFGVPAFARYYAVFADRRQLDELFSMPETEGLPWYVLGGGSNVLFTGDYEGLMLQPVGKRMEAVEESGETVSVRAEAGVVWDDFVRFCVERGYGGVENLSGIPGSVGAAPVQNVGAYGAEAKDVIREVEIYLPQERTVRMLRREECAFGYRDSVFKRELKGRAIVLSVTFELSRMPVFRLGYGDLVQEVERLGGASPENVRRAVISIRNAKLPDPAVLGNSGSFFKNPVVAPEAAERLKARYPEMPSYPAPGGGKLAAGWLIDRAGWKGRREGRVGVHDRQALVLVNHGGAAGSEVLELARRIVADVAEKFGVELELEVNVL